MIKWVTLVVFFLCISAVSEAQTSKGDNPVNNRGKLREARFKTRNKQGDRPKTRDVAGRRLRTKNQSSANQAINYPLPQAARSARKRAKGGEQVGKPVGGIYGSQPRNNQNAWKGGSQGNTLSYTERAKAQNVYSNRAQLSMLKKYQRDPGDNGGKRNKVIQRSATKTYMARRSVNPMSRFSRPKGKKGEVAFLTDPAGRKLRGKNYETPRPGVVVSSDPYHGRKRVGDRPYAGSRFQGTPSATKSPKAWSGDIAGRKIRGRNHQSKINTGGNRYSMGGPSPRYGDHQRHVKTRRSFGGGSATLPPEKRTGKMPLPVRIPEQGARGVGNYSGNIKFKKPDKGGGSVSGKNWNNNQTPLPVRAPSSDAQRAGAFQGNVKWKRPEKGGGSVSGKLWNNNESPILVRQHKSQRGLAFQGNIKGRKPEKGGGSVSFKLWNNNEKPIQVQPPSDKSQRALSFQGNIKGRKPEKGGGSVSGETWNNDETPIKVKPPYKGARSAYAYTGDQKLKRFNRSYARNPNSSEDALMQRRPDKAAYKADELQTKVKQYNYIKNPSSADAALKVREPGKAFVRATDYQGNIKMKKFDLFARNDLHPDSKFVKINKNNVSEEKDLLTNFKLWWSNMFKKNETQPDHLKEKERRPRYDNGEQGLWYD